MISDVSERRADIEVLCRAQGVRRLELFGSAASGAYRPGESDLDFLVEFVPDPPGGYAEAYFGLLEGLEKMFGCKVDVVVYAAIRNPYFMQSVERTRTLLYAA
ncbi:MAG: nucleotidyltransferase domain-containing protein [Candidatus Eisenbacteria bacterium]|nr:nucleotidyltransferase domain-containing protein [Candidatus Eisenbacteria bacterium]